MVFIWWITKEMQTRSISRKTKTSNVIHWKQKQEIH